MPAVPGVRSLRRVVRQRRERPTVDLAHPSRSPLGTSVVGCVAYDAEGTRLLGECTVAEAHSCVRKGDEGGFVWIGLHEPSEEEFEGVTELFGLHPLAVDNAIEAHQRPKAEWYGGEMMYAVFKTVSYVEHEKLTNTSEVVDTGEIVVFTGADFVITVRHGPHGSLGPLRESLEADPERLAQGPAAVLHAIADQVVDDYLLVADEVQTDIDNLEVDVFTPGGAGGMVGPSGRGGAGGPSGPSGPSGMGGGGHRTAGIRYAPRPRGARPTQSRQSKQSALVRQATRATPGSLGSDTGRIYQLKRELLELKRAAGPLARPLELLSTRPNKLIDAEIRKYFRDVADHLARVTEQIAAFDALLDSILQAHLAQVSAAQNEGMRRISAWVAIVAVPTMVCGVYGMNFDHMPELHWKISYPVVLVVMAAICFAMHRAFRRNGWL